MSRFCRCRWMHWFALGCMGSAVWPNVVAIAALSPMEQPSSLPASTAVVQSNPGAMAVTHDLTALKAALNAQNWALADQETRRLLAPTADPYGPNATLLSLDLIRSIDHAWVAASGGHFGFSVQAKIWQQTQAQNPNNTEAAVHGFRDRVGWKLTSPRPENNFTSRDWLNFTSRDWLNEGELNYSIQAPMGHLPWAGVAESKILQLIPGPGESCGSCTIDMMFLRNERFYQYLPDLFAQVQRALTIPKSVMSDWRSPQRLHRISISSLYPNGRQAHPTAQAISPDSQLLGIVSTTPSSQTESLSAFALWNLAPGTRRVTLIQPEPGSPHPQAIAFTPDSQRVVAGLSDGTIRVWETTKGTALLSWQAHRDAIRAFALSPNGEYLVSGSVDRTLKVWDARKGRLLQTLRLTAGESQSSPVQTLQISPDGQRLAVATERTIQLWDFLRGRLIKVAVQLSPSEAPSLQALLPLAMAFSPNGAYLATLDTDHSIKLWNSSNGARFITLRQHQSPIQALAFRPDGQRLISRDRRQSVLFWNLTTYQRDRTISVAHGHRVVMPEDSAIHHRDDMNVDRVTVWPHESIATLQPLTLSPDGGTLAVPLSIGALPHYSIELRDLATDELASRIAMAQQGQFSQDNRYFVTLGPEVQVWRP